MEHVIDEREAPRVKMRVTWVEHLYSGSSYVEF